MIKFVLLASAAALAAATPAAADPGHGRGNGHGHGHAGDEPANHWAGNCPPGLRDKGCMPPGQARKFSRGQRYDDNGGRAYAYDQIPYSVRRQYRLNPRYRYYYVDRTIYVVDPRTMLVQQVINALLR